MIQHVVLQQEQSNPIIGETTSQLGETTSPSGETTSQLPSGLGNIEIYGARQHNLKNIDITIPRFKFVVITGVSGSGKSSLAFDTLYAEGQRRYVESLSAYARH